MVFFSVRFVLALVALVAGVGIAVAAWPHLAASLMLSASVTAWTHEVSAPIAGRTSREPAAPGSRVGPDGTIMEIVNDRLDRTPVLNAEAAFQAAQARVAAAKERLEVLRLAEDKRRGSMLRTSAVEPVRDSEREIGRAGAELGVARVSEREGLHVLMTEREAYRAKRSARVKGPPGATLYSVAVGGAVVEAGDPIARWIDCDELLVDAPVFDPWLRLLSVGGKGQVMLDGEDTWRDGKIIALNRSGDAADARELATVAKGRDRGAGQVLLRLAATSADFDRCPLGRAAYVRLPDLDLLARFGFRSERGSPGKDRISP
jgi:multidrug efflux pump subunit AcrA (membrane-fusion protein)